MQPLIVSGLISFIANLLIGSFVLSRNPKNRVNLLFFLFSLTVSGWSIGSFLENIIPNKAIALNVLRTNYLFAIWLPPIGLHFVYAFTAITRTRRKILYGAYLVSILLSTVAYTPFFINELRLLQVDPYPFFISSPGPLYYVFFLFFGVSMCEVFRTTFYEMRQNVGQRYLQSKYLTVANAIAIAAGFEYFSRVFGLLQSPPLDDYILILYLMVLAYAIVKHQLLDIKVIIKRSLVYSGLIAAITAVYLVVVLILERSFQGVVGYQSVVATVVVAFLIAIGFNPMRDRLQRLVDRALFKATPIELAEQRERFLVELRKADQMKAIATLAAGMAHEIKNPLTAIKTFTAFLPQKGRDPEFQEKFARIVSKEVERIDATVRQLLEFAKPTPPALQPVRLARLLEDTIDLLSNECRTRRVHVERTYVADATIQADPQQLRQVFLNLCLNSLEAMTSPPARSPEGPAPDGAALPPPEAASGGMDGHGGTLTVQLIRPHTQQVRVVIRDTGCGMTPEQQARIFEPFFTTKTTGTGLGLAVVQRIVTEHGGTIAIESTPGKGTMVCLDFSVVSSLTVSA